MAKKLKEQNISESSINNSADFTAENTTSDNFSTHHERPRTLGIRDALFHLDADWGTSLAYILPLSLSLAGRLAPVYMIIISIIMFIVANGYKVVCRHNPDGGGVYSSLKKVNKFLAVIGAFLLITDYIVTEALSVSDSYHYLSSSVGLNKIIQNPTIWTIAILVILTIINWRGEHFSAKFAGIASSSTFFLAGVLAVLALPLIPQGLANIGQFNQSIFDVLRNTVGVLLALSGVEAISNMTGIMKDPVKVSKGAINLELVKVVFTTVVLGIAMNALPLNVTRNFKQQGDGPEVLAYKDGRIYNVQERLDFSCVAHKIYYKVKGLDYTCGTVITDSVKDDMLVQMGQYLVPGPVGQIYGVLIGLAYGLLLIFAGNTALIGITNVTYSLAKDGELPLAFTRLNKGFGVPVFGLIAAGILPMIVVLIVGANVEALAALYAIGVVGAVTLNLAGTTIQVQGGERIITGIGAVVMGILLITLILNKMEATIFASIVLIIGLSARAIQKMFLKANNSRNNGISTNNNDINLNM